MEQNISSRVYQSGIDLSEGDPIRMSFTGYSFSISYIFILLIIVFVTIASFIKYPDTQEGNLQLINGSMNYKLTPSYPGKIKLLITDISDTISAGDIVAYIENSAELEDVEILKKIINQAEHDSFFLNTDFPRLRIGELSIKYMNLVNSVRDLKNYLREKKNNYIGLSIENKLKYTKKIIDENDMGLLKILARNEVLKNLNSRDSVLLTKQIISASDFERDNVNRLTISQDKFALERFKFNSMESYEDAIIALNNYRYNSEIKTIELQNRVFDAIVSLEHSIREWRNKYLIISPSNGTIELNDKILNGTFVHYQDVIYTVKPNNSGWQANMYIDQANAAKIKPGQKVIIRLSMFPSSDFGHLVGKVKNMSDVPIYIEDKDKVKTMLLVKVELPKELVSSNKIKIEPINELAGVGEIITEEKRLIQRLMNF